MDLEQGDYFVVTRGIELMPMNALDNLFLFGHTSTREQEKHHYDRSYSGLVFQAEEVAWPAVCARIIATNNPDSYAHPIGQCLSLNLQELEVMVVPQSFVAHMTQEETKP